MSEKNSKIRHGLIMAAGRGTRMAPLTDLIPKPMAPLWGSTLIANGIEKIKPHLDNLHITVGYKGADLAKHVIELGVSSVINTEGHGNAWWIFNSLLKTLNEPILVMTADNVTDFEIDSLLQEYRRLNSPPCMVVPVIPVKGLDGDFIHQKNNIVYSLDRKLKAPTYCSGIQILNPFLINELMSKKEDFYEVWVELIKISKLFSSSVLPNKWFTVDTILSLTTIQNRKKQ
ncbi:nucleotidyltransferase-like protein [Algoriphagus aquaeductus]|uniref:Nucleotidyltransferase-like protein n=1 Tax=Algoriphagus aquaeductus TaxID=475299 RepID=A0A326RKP4_9BACT|nr:sugar phosphate nucleotidyltransferase [Algoriphagus aquaeductus]PZV76710.1 nucleotidyltransferase-like protein [Algoriphagus aquaeductus]